MLRRLTDPLGKCLTQDDELALGSNSLYYDLTGGIQVPDMITVYGVRKPLAIILMLFIC